MQSNCNNNHSNNKSSNKQQISDETKRNEPFCIQHRSTQYSSAQLNSTQFSLHFTISHVQQSKQSYLQLNLRFISHILFYWIFILLSLSLAYSLLIFKFFLCLYISFSLSLFFSLLLSRYISPYISLQCKFTTPD